MVISERVRVASSYHAESQSVLGTTSESAQPASSAGSAPEAGRKDVALAAGGSLVCTQPGSSGERYTVQYDGISGSTQHNALDPGNRTVPNKEPRRRAGLDDPSSPRRRSRRRAPGAHPTA